MAFYSAEIPDTPRSPWEKAPLLRMAAVLIAGMGTGWLCRDFIGSTVWLTATLALGVLALFYWKKGKKNLTLKQAGLLALFSLGSAGASLIQLRYENLQVDYPEQSRLWCAEVVNRHKVYDNGVSLDLSLNDTSRYDRQRIRVRVEGPEGKTLSTGDRLTFHAPIHQPRNNGNPCDFDYRTYLLTQGITGTAFVSEKNWARLSAPSQSSLLSRIQHLRTRLTDRYADRLNGETYCLMSALTLGDKTMLDNETKDLFSDTGTSHVLALSGLHLGILYTLLHLFFLRWFRRRIPYFIAHLLTIAVLWFFVLLAGAPLSLLRAAFMFTLWIGCTCIQRTHSTGLNNLCLAAIVLLLCSPLSLLDVSFQLSFSAVLGILLCNDYIWYRHALPDWWDEDEIDKALLNTTGEEASISRWHRCRIRLKHLLTPPVWKFLKQTVVPFFTVSLSAQIGTLPFILYYFHQFTPYALLANLIVIPAAYLLIGCALLFFLLPFPLLQTLLGRGISLVSSTMLDGLDTLSRWPGATLQCYPSLPTLCALSVLPFLLYGLWQTHRKRSRKQLIYGLTFCLIVGLCSEAWSHHQRTLTPQILVYNVPRTTLIHFVVSNDTSYLYSSVPADTTAFKIRSIRQQFWEPYHLAEPQPVTTDRFEAPLLHRKGDIFLFGHETVYLLHHRLHPSGTAPPIPLHTLLVQRGCYDSLAVVRQVFLPRHVVLDRSLPTRLRRRWKKECEEAGIPCHDIRQDGAFIKKLPHRKEVATPSQRN